VCPLIQHPGSMMHLRPFSNVNFSPIQVACAGYLRGQSQGLSVVGKRATQPGLNMW
jgi:hypothetical protein